MTISPQLGHGSFVASPPGGIIRWHEVHVGMATLTLSLKATPQGKLDIDITLLYVLSFNEILKTILS